MRGWGGRVFVSPCLTCFANFPGRGGVVWCLFVVCVWFLFCCFLASRETSASN